MRTSNVDVQAFQNKGWHFLFVSLLANYANISGNIVNLVEKFAVYCCFVYGIIGLKRQR